MKLPKKSVWICFFIHTLLIIVAYFFSTTLPQREPAGFIDQSLYPLSPYLEKFIRWDAHWYTYIAGHGYSLQSIVFFPAIILLIKVLSFLGLHLAFAGLLICNTFALLSFWVMYLTFRLDYAEGVANRALISYALMPTSFFLNSIYTEPIFITASLACIYFARVNKWWYAGISGALAVLTRNLGIFLVLFLLYEAIKKNSHTKRRGSLVFPLLLPFIAILLFMVYNFYFFQNPIAFATSQHAWGRQFGFPWQNIWNNLPLAFVPNLTNQPGVTLDSFLVIASAIGLSCLTFSPKFKVHNSYLIIGWLWFLIPLMFTSSELPLYSMARFILPIFPLYLFFAQLPNYLFYCIIILSATTLLLCTSLFINWYWIG